MELVHRLGAKAERKVEKELIEDLKRVHGKTGMLYRLAEAPLEHPTGVVQEVIFPVVSEATLRDVVKEWKATGPFYGFTNLDHLVSAVSSLTNGYSVESVTIRDSQIGAKKSPIAASNVVKR